MRSRADIVFPDLRIAVFVDGCFWHGCPIHGTQPKSNSTWWTEKLTANRERDRRVTASLQAAGWLVIRIWEHEAPPIAARLIAHHVSMRRNSSST
jgi:DNA mismatch endonuclease, patch repair protein